MKRVLSRLLGLTSYDNMYAVLKTVADHPSPDSEPASGKLDRGDNCCSEAVKM
jgi:hypothetical protein